MFSPRYIKSDVVFDAVNMYGFDWPPAYNDRNYTELSPMLFNRNGFETQIHT